MLRFEEWKYEQKDRKLALEKKIMYKELACYKRLLYQPTPPKKTLKKKSHSPHFDQFTPSDKTRQGFFSLSATNKSYRKP